MKNASEHATLFSPTYRELVAMHPPRQIHTDAECAAASKIVEKMIGHELNADQEDYMDLLATLIIQYDQAHHPIKSKQMSPIEVLNYMIEESGMTASDLGRLLGNRELGSKILRDDRGLSLAHIAKLSEYFKVSAELFIPRPSVIKTRKSAKPKAQWRGQSGTRASRAKS